MAKESTTISEYHLNIHQPEKPQFAIHDLKNYVNKNLGNTTRPHIHSYYQVIWFKKANGVHFVDFKSYDVKDNTVFFTAKNQVHYFDDNLDYEGYLIHFNEAFLVRKENETDFCLKCSLFNNPYSQFPFCAIDEKLHNVLNEYLMQIENELQHPEEFGKEELLRNYLKSFLIQLQREKSSADKDGNFSNSIFDEKRMLLIKFIDLIDGNYNKGLTISEYAGILQVSTRTLSDLTHQLIGKTPSLMIQERIILEAKRMLLYSNLNINQIGYRLGFDDPSYFVKYFKKHTQSSPSDFRKSVS